MYTDHCTICRYANLFTPRMCVHTSTCLLYVCQHLYVLYVNQCLCLCFFVISLTLAAVHMWVVGHTPEVAYIILTIQDGCRTEQCTDCTVLPCSKTAFVNYFVYVCISHPSLCNHICCCIRRYEECKVKLLPFLKKVGFNPNRGRS